MSNSTETGCLSAVVGLVVLGGLLVLVPVGCAGCWAANKTGALAEQEFSPEVLLRKYEWFKDAAAKLDAKAAGIAIAEGRLKGLEAQYSGAPRKEWARADVEQSNLWSQEVAGLKSSYNNLAADYNARMAKVNFRFCNAGDLPKGADKPLPREFRSYLTN